VRDRTRDDGAAHREHLVGRELEVGKVVGHGGNLHSKAAERLVRAVHPLLVIELFSYPSKHFSAITSQGAAAW
jgi:hypothetical protein